MTTNVLITRQRLKWLLWAAFAACVLLVIVGNVVEVGVKVSKNRDVTVYSGPISLLIMMIVLGVMICTLAAVCWLKAGPLNRALSRILFLMAFLFLFLTVPSLLSNSLVVTPDFFLNRTGVWFWPAETKVEFNTIAHMTIQEAEQRGRNESEYELQCFKKLSGEKVCIRINDPMKRALPEIFRNAAQRGVVIGESSEGGEIPPDLRK